MNMGKSKKKHKQQKDQAQDKEACPLSHSGESSGSIKLNGLNTKAAVCQSQNEKVQTEDACSSSLPAAALTRKRGAPTDDALPPGSSDNKVPRLDLESGEAGSSSSSVKPMTQKQRRKKRQAIKKKAARLEKADPYSHLTEQERNIVIHCNTASSKELVTDSKSSSCHKIPQTSSRPNNSTSRDNSVILLGEAKVSVSSDSSALEDSVIFVKETFVKKTQENNFSRAITSTPGSLSFGNRTVMENPSHNTSLFTSTPVTSSRGKNVGAFPTLTPIGLPSSTSFSYQKSTTPLFTRKDAEPVFSFSCNGIGSECVASSTRLFPSGFSRGSPIVISSGSPDTILVSSSPRAESSRPCAAQEASLSDTLSKTLTPGKHGGKHRENDSVIVVEASPPAPSRFKPVEVIEILDSDTEDMDVDDDDVIQSLLTVREQTTLSQDAGSLSETINKSTVQRLSPPPKMFKQLVLVIDTNILIHSLSFFANLLSVELSDYGRPLVLMPWMVILELDKLKTDRPGWNKMDPAVAYRARKAVRLLEKLIVDHHPRLTCQLAAETSPHPQEFIIDSNDDLILYCGLQWKKRHENDEVVLVTRDRNLGTKALINNLKTSTNTDLWDMLKIPTPAIFLEDRVNSTVSSLEKAYNNGAKRVEGDIRKILEKQQGQVGQSPSRILPYLGNSQAKVLRRLQTSETYQLNPHPQAHLGNSQATVQKQLQFLRQQLQMNRNQCPQRNPPTQSRFGNSRATVQEQQKPPTQPRLENPQATVQQQQKPPSQPRLQNPQATVQQQLQTNKNQPTQQKPPTQPRLRNPQATAQQQLQNKSNQPAQQNPPTQPRLGNSQANVPQQMETNQNQPPQRNLPIPPLKMTGQPQNLKPQKQAPRCQSQPQSQENTLRAVTQPRGNSQNVVEIQTWVAKEEKDRQTFAKFSAVWDLILNARSELFSIIEHGPRDIRFREACCFLKTLQELIKSFANSLNECLCLSPIILRSNKASGPFSRLVFLLNNFHKRMGSSVDFTMNISSGQVIDYFDDMENRLRLAKGRDELGEILASMNVFQTTHFTMMTLY